MRGRQSTRGGSRGGRGDWMLVRKDSSEYRDSNSNSNRSRGGVGGRGGSRVYSNRPSGQRNSNVQDSSSSLSESQTEHSSPKVVSESTLAVAPASLTTSSQSSDVPAVPRAASARKPKQSKP